MFSPLKPTKIFKTEICSVNVRENIFSEIKTYGIIKFVKRPFN